MRGGPHPDQPRAAMAARRGAYRLSAWLNLGFRVCCLGLPIDSGLAGPPWTGLPRLAGLVEDLSRQSAGGGAGASDLGLIRLWTEHGAVLASFTEHPGLRFHVLGLLAWQVGLANGAGLGAGLVPDASAGSGPGPVLLRMFLNCSWFA